ncbi:MAG: iron-containing alcohol dehydrogenase [Deltaproteobacteria bacterium]|nr:iron-containing alcohol dehydrogenase [Deltaproteobacteria bacterium]
MSSRSYNMERVSPFFAPNRILLGKGVAGQVGQEVRMLGGKKVLIVTDPGVVKVGLTAAIEEGLKAEGIPWGIYADVVPEPPARIIDEAAKIAREGNYDTVIGIGGGSSLDVAKGVAMMATHTGKALDYVGQNMFKERGLTKILIPTTAGTGSEATGVCVVTDEEENTKKSYYSHLLLPESALLDPLLTVSMPPSVTADTGMDALSHAVESFVSVNRTPHSEILSLEAIRLIAESMAVACLKGSELWARYNMLLASNLAGMAFTSGGLGASHGLAYPLGTEYHIPHGKSNAIMLPHVMRFNRVACPEQFAKIAVAMGQPIEGLPLYDAAEMACEAVEQLIETIGLSSRLPDYGVPDTDIPRLVECALKQSRFFVPNPRNLGEKEIRSIYEMAF